MWNLQMNVYVKKEEEKKKKVFTTGLNIGLLLWAWNGKKVQSHNVVIYMRTSV